MQVGVDLKSKSRYQAAMRRILLSLLVAFVTGSVSGCVSTGAKTAFATARSSRLESGYFFGHDVRLYRDVVYVLDLSGSMSGRTGSAASQVGTQAGADLGGSLLSGFVGHDLGSAASETVLDMNKKVELVKDHLIASLRGLPPGSDFNVILFSNGVQKLAPSPLSANTTNVALVTAFVAQLEEGGSTSLYNAIEAALSTDAEEIMVLTDGLPTDSTPQSILGMVRSKLGGTQRRVYTVGVGADQARDFLTHLAEDNGGKYLQYD
jgi:uncharacterized protein YegL